MIGEVCTPLLRQLGLSCRLEFLVFPSQTTRHIYMIWLQMPGQFGLDPQTLYSLRLFLTASVERAFGLEARSIRLVLHFHLEDDALADPRRMVTADWLQSRIRGLSIHHAQTGAAAAQAAREPLAPSMSSSAQTARANAPAALRAYSSIAEDVAGLHVSEASMTDFSMELG